jgi:hypothetical protein
VIRPAVTRATFGFRGIHVVGERSYTLLVRASRSVAPTDSVWPTERSRTCGTVTAIAVARWRTHTVSRKCAVSTVASSTAKPFESARIVPAVASRRATAFPPETTRQVTDTPGIATWAWVCATACSVFVSSRL